MRMGEGRVTPPKKKEEEEDTVHIEKRSEYSA